MLSLMHSIGSGVTHIFDSETQKTLCNRTTQSMFSGSGRHRCTVCERRGDFEAVRKEMIQRHKEAQLARERKIQEIEELRQINEVEYKQLLKDIELSLASHFSYVDVEPNYHKRGLEAKVTLDGRTVTITARW